MASTSRLPKEADIDKKILDYETFVNERLRSDLKTVLDQRDAVLQEIEEYETLKTTIEKLKEANRTTDLKTQVDLGQNFFVNAVVPDASKIFVKLGYGFFAELSLNEAVNFSDKRIALLLQKADSHANSANRIKANIHVVLQGLNELQNSRLSQLQ
uniref:Protein UXT n=1 Tax=Plectus sambesii TaxID=2011161 RepID=A0A914W815_9BILA